MTLQELKYLVAVADHLHFGRAAAACHVTQPTLSAGLGSLEDKLGMILCERGPRGVLLTRTGAEVVEQARRVLAETRQLEQIAARGRAPLSGVFRLGAIPTVGPYLFPHVIGGLHARWPQLRLHLIEAQTDALLRDLKRGELDAVLLSPPVADDGLTCRPLYREEFLLALPPGHDLARRKRLTVADLNDEALLLLDEGHCLRDQVLEFCRIGTAAARDLLRSGSLETLRNMVAAGVGTTLLPALATTGRHADSFALRRFGKAAPSREIGLYWRNQAPINDAANLLATQIVAQLPDTVTPLD